MTIRYGPLSTHPPTRCGLATFDVAIIQVARRTHPVAGARS
jgi:hypothetical protein